MTQTSQMELGAKYFYTHYDAQPDVYLNCTTTYALSHAKGGRVSSIQLLDPNAKMETATKYGSDEKKPGSVPLATTAPVAEQA